jgi:hypothetical protein
MGDTAADRPSSKVARLLEEYDLDGLGADLEARWTGDGIDRMSLRDLAEFFNKRLLEQALLDAGMSSLESDLDGTYQHLTGEDVSTGVRTEARSRLERHGIDVDALESDFVTYQAIRSYLKEWRGAEYEGVSDTEKLEKDLETIQRLLTRTHSVAEHRIELLRDTDRLALERFEVLLDAQALCQECGTQYSLAELFERGGCDCVKR